MFNWRMPFAAHAALSIACFFWAISFLATKIVVPVVPPLTVVFLRFVIAAICFLLWTLYKKSPPTFRGRRWFWGMVALSSANALLHYGLQTIGLQYTTAANGSLYAITGPLATFIIGALWLGEKITVKKGLGFLLALVGVLVVMGLATLQAIDWTSHLLGDLLVIASIVTWAACMTFGKKLLQKMSAVEITAIMTWMGMLLMAPISYIEMQQRDFHFHQMTTAAWGGILFLGLTCSFLASLLYLMALNRTESQKAGTYLYTIPPMTYLFAGIFLHEPITSSLLIGTLLVVIGIYVTERG